MLPKYGEKSSLIPKLITTLYYYGAMSTYLNDLHGEEGVVHSQDGRLDVPGCRESVDHDLNVLCSLLTQHCYGLHLLRINLHTHTGGK